MIKIVVSAITNEGKKVTRSFQSKINRPISLGEVDKLMVFANSSLSMGYRTNLNYKITYKNNGIIASLGGNSHPIVMQSKIIQQFNSMINTINANCKTQ